MNSSFLSYPGLLVLHSRDLVNWEPVGAALKKNVGSIWAPDLTKVGGRYYIYFPGVTEGVKSNYVVWADSIKGPWSEPIDLKIGQIDPGHAVGADGKRYLFLSGGNMVPLADDGLSVVGKMTHVYSGWKYPEEWVVEGFAQEGPKILKHGDYYYMVLAEGGTAGPPTSHMVVEARSKVLEGPWENCPYNPIVHTKSGEERWWSRGHATPVEGPDGKWYLVYHAYEKGFYTLGRQTLLEPIEWTADGWFKATGVDVAKPIAMPTGGEVVKGERASSDDFSTDRMGTGWVFFNPAGDYASQYRYEKNCLVVKGKGESPKDCNVLTVNAGDLAYEVEVEMEVGDGARGGLILFYNEKWYAGVVFDAGHVYMERYGTERASTEAVGNRLHVRLVNDRNVVSAYTSGDGETWMKFGTGWEVSGYHHNVMGGFLSLRPAIYAAGTGEVRFRGFRYRALP